MRGQAYLACVMLSVAFCSVSSQQSKEPLEGAGALVTLNKPESDLGEALQEIAKQGNTVIVLAAGAKDLSRKTAVTLPSLSVVAALARMQLLFPGFQVTRVPGGYVFFRPVYEGLLRSRLATIHTGGADPSSLREAIVETPEVTRWLARRKLIERTFVQPRPYAPSAPVEYTFANQSLAEVLIDLKRINATHYCSIVQYGDRAQFVSFNF